MNFEIIPKEDIFGSEEDIFGPGADIRENASKAGHKGYGKHKNQYRTDRMHRLLTDMVADILRETEEVKMYSTYGQSDKRMYYDFFTKNYGKVKHLYSLGRVRKNSSVYYYEFIINYHRGGFTRPNTYILTAYILDSDSNILYPMHFWIIDAKEKIRTQRTYLEFCERSTFTIYGTKESILKMKKYEDIKKLEKMQKVNMNCVIDDYYAVLSRTLECLRDDVENEK